MAWFNGKRLTIQCDNEGFASKIRIEGAVAADDMIAKLVIQEPGKPLHFHSAGGNKIREELETELKLIESTLGVFFRIGRIRWEEAMSIAIPETPSEESQIQWNNLSVTREPDDPARAPTLEDLSVILHMGYHARDLATTMSFFREGDMDLRTHRYISAFFSFYFVLEGLYGNGQFGGKEVRAEFGKSVVLTDAIEHVLTLPGFRGPAKFKDVLSIDHLLKLVSKDRDVEGIIHMLVWTRGDLHHFVNNPKKLTGSPFTHRRYEPLASFAHDICLNVLMHEIQARFPTSGSKII
ncbi:MAG: hypothetical protein LAP61_27575 [Acidobacteriia bacterium]|nr:hypothetical protein [Terriglobia bacterium]